MSGAQAQRGPEAGGAIEKLKMRRALRRKIFSKDRPEFLRALWWKFPKFKNKLRWVKPKGKDNKMRLKIKGYPPLAEAGYRTPRDIRGFHPSGLRPAVVSSPKDLEGLRPEEHIIYIASTVGSRKRAELIRIAEEKGFRIANR